MENIYVSLDEARSEIKRRWNDVELKKRIEVELGEKFMPSFKNKPRGLLWRSLPSPDNGFTFFFQCSHYINTDPLVLEYLEDKFVSINPEKKGLCNFRVYLGDGQKGMINIADINSYEGKKLNEIILKTGENLVDFYHKLFDVSKYSIELKDITGWCHDIGSASDYYYPYLLHFVAHGVLFEFFVSEEDPRENSFTNDIIMPALKKIEDKFGIKPLVIRTYPEDQTDDEDFYWWCYPPNINSYIVNYAKENKLNFKKIII